MSHIVSTFSGKPIFGQNGPLYNYRITQQTICRKVKELIKFIIRDTKIISNLIYSFLVTILVYFYNPQITKAHIRLLLYKSIILHKRLSMQVGISEAIRLLSTDIYNRFILNVNKDLQFNEWLGGLIDGDGCFQLSKKGYASLEIVMQLRDKHCLYQIKDRFGGSIKLRSGANHLRYRLHHKEGLLKLINSINGLIRNPIRIHQLNKICDKYKIDLILPSPLTYNNGWLAGFLDSDGSIYLQSEQLLITATQKNKLLLDPLIELYGGSIYTLKSAEAFKWVIYRKDELICLLDYFSKYSLRSAKKNRVNMIPKYFELRSLKAHIATNNSILGKAWKSFLNKWK